MGVWDFFYHFLYKRMGQWKQQRDIFFSSGDQLDPKQRPLPLESTAFEETKLIELHIFNTP